MTGIDAARGAVTALVSIAALMPAAADASDHAPLPGFDCDPLAGAEAGSNLAAARPSGPSALAEGEQYVEQAYRRALRRGPELRRGRPARATGPVRVPVHMHVIQDDATTGAVPPAQIARQMQVLNDSFAGATGGHPTGIQFELIDTDVTINSAWYPINRTDPPTPQEVAMKTALREGGHRALNVYIVDAGGLLGWATFPDEYAAEPELDGVVVETTSLPGGSAAPYDEGDTLPHEVGHWLGLFHTFQGGCGTGTSGGDLVADTPADQDPDYGCPVVNSCPDDPGNDPVDNFMSYSDDDCMHRFTPGQTERAHDQTALYRNGAPQLSAAPLAAEAGRPLAFEVQGSDPDGDPLTYAVVEGPDHGTLEGNGPSFTYMPGAKRVGPDSAVVRATDVFGASADTTIAITVAGDDAVRLKAKAKAKQKLRRLAVEAGCGGEGCELTARAKIKAKPPKDEGGKARKLSTKKATGSAKPNGTRELELELAKAKAKRLAGLLAGGWTAKAKVKVSATDAAGNRARERSSIKLR